ncbi:hypothetical protein LTR86_009656 [Recurvomyces mirabilis]|nr:hypothetical protein LTR86_009656 [Recurvomyces mirabilis]
MPEQAGDDTTAGHNTVRVTDSFNRQYREIAQDEWNEEDLAALRLDRSDLEMADEYELRGGETVSHEESSDTDDLTTLEVYRMHEMEATDEPLQDETEDAMSCTSDDSDEFIDPLPQAQPRESSIVANARIPNEEERDQDGSLRATANETSQLWGREADQLELTSSEMRAHIVALIESLERLDTELNPRINVVVDMLGDLVGRYMTDGQQGLESADEENFEGQIFSSAALGRELGPGDSF